ncbi:DUF6344 domain-containing protein [Streptomyces sp. RY43-2]|uniref:DUF6344 domain-containing protein n=1 Tax=Streptomyces macrolidinus TaxID=2952607 RepID=A0ABT0ZES9_9ACTN|nr:DUF6344 domain-containing protein [Streptomyces macrolidinus]MCN9242073.1 DUF6344 domain-containing protein [Streptomyces macrolidinus]
MAENKVMTLWTAIVTAFLALCTALGLITPAAAAAVPQPQPEHNSSTRLTPPKPRPLQRRAARERSLPPTMKQRIHAEAHNTSPSCRRDPLMDLIAADPLPPSVPRPRTEPIAPHKGTTPLQS